ncbi:hypothetical protein [Aequorivita marina]|uniref:hypothetical protein n=1 Tax=Aequorivita marina TaxID=3073654 RepID=UPI002876783F|nr:hypothetical protein [Aequorivita sp. S2608]MDS1297123.1 hypothetical protein [Aequorivita sp. S2608]
MEKYSTLLLLVSMFFGIFISCDSTPPKTGTLMDYIPQDPEVVFKISNLGSVQADIANNALLSKFENTSPHSFFSEKASLQKNLHPESESLLCLNKLNDSVSGYTFISKNTKNLFQADSITEKTVETLTLDQHQLQRITIADNVAYMAVKDSVFIASSSQQLLLDVLKGKTERSATFSKVYNLPTTSVLTGLIHGKKAGLNDSTAINFTSWSALDLAIAPESLTATGISLATDTIPQLLNVFDGQTPQENNIANLVPMDALGAVSFTFNDAEKFQKKLSEFRGETVNTEIAGVFGSISEAGAIQLKKDTAVFLKSIDPLMTGDALARYLSVTDTFREIKISSFSEPELFQKSFSPFISFKKANFMIQLEDFFVFTENEITAKQIISDFQNNKTLKNTSYYKNTANDLSTSSSLLIYKMQGEFTETLLKFLPFKSKEELNNIALDAYPLAVLQFSYDRNFAHVILSIKKAGASAQNDLGEVSEKFNLKLDNTILGNPQLVASSNIVVQDIGNKLYFISQGGKILWTKNLGAPIMGNIKEVNISGKAHIAFTTKDAVYILDRNGKPARSFPIKFKDEVTQPLSVFDYDGNQNYRFVVVQGQDVLMYDKRAKIVKGFGFTKAKSSIVQPPVHIRMGNKDYIVIAEKSGKLNILSRVGKTRVPVSNNFNFSDIPITHEDNNFVVITKENTKEQISQSGQVSSIKLNVGSNYWFAMEGKTKATLDDNLLRIDGKLAELPLGLYTNPKMFTINRKVYVTITETQEKKVYVFDKNSTLLNGYPVYGTSEASLDGGRTKHLVVKGESDSVLMYSF